MKLLTNDERGKLEAKLLQSQYGKYAEAWKDGFGDRRLIDPILNQMLGACEARRHIEDNYCQVAISKAINEDKKVLDEIIGYFTGVTPRSNGYIENPDPIL